MKRETRKLSTILLALSCPLVLAFVSVASTAGTPQEPVPSIPEEPKKVKMEERTVLHFTSWLLDLQEGDTCFFSNNITATRQGDQILFTDGTEAELPTPTSILFADGTTGERNGTEAHFSNGVDATIDKTKRIITYSDGTTISLHNGLDGGKISRETSFKTKRKGNESFQFNTGVSGEDWSAKYKYMYTPSNHHSTTSYATFSDGTDAVRQGNEIFYSNGIEGYVDGNTIYFSNGIEGYIDGDTIYYSNGVEGSLDSYSDGIEGSGDIPYHGGGQKQSYGGGSSSKEESKPKHETRIYYDGRDYYKVVDGHLRYIY